MSKARLVYRYFQHQLQGKKRHGLHSPFVYELVDQVILDHGPREAYAPIEKLRKSLLQSKAVIEVKDFGAGSHIHASNQRKVGEITKYSAKSPALAQLLFRLVEHLQPKTMLELGTSLGISTLYEAKAMADAQFITLEGCPATAGLARKHLDEGGM